MGIKELFNKAGKGIKTLFKKDGAIQSTFNKGVSFANDISKKIDKGIGGALNLGSRIGEIASNVAPALSAINPELGLAAMAVGNAANRATGYVQGIKNKKQDIVNKKNDVKRGIMLPKPIPEENNMEPNVNFA